MRIVAEIMGGRGEAEFLDSPEEVRKSVYQAFRETGAKLIVMFFFFENWLYTATYMADARAQELPLVTTGDPDFVEHDFHAIFSNLGVLDYDTKIAAAVRILGWLGMLACSVSLWIRMVPPQIHLWK